MPAAAPDVVATVMVELLPEVTEAGLKETVTPAGAPEADSATVWADPLVVAVEMVLVAEAPGSTLPADGLAAREKSFAGVALPTASFHRV